VVSNGNKSAYTRHVSNEKGTVGTVRGSGGGKAIGGSTDRGSGFAGKTAGGDMYAGRNGNVFKNTGSGWDKYEHGSWNSVNSPQTNARDRAQTSDRASGANRTAARDRSVSQTRASSGFGDIDRDFQSRQRGGASSERYSNFQRSGGGGRSFSGAARGGGRRR
jgi:hypothetical protein